MYRPVMVLISLKHESGADDGRWALHGSNKVLTYSNLLFELMFVSGAIAHSEIILINGYRKIIETCMHHNL